MMDSKKQPNTLKIKPQGTKPRKKKGCGCGKRLKKENYKHKTAE